MNNIILPILIKDDSGNEFMLENFQQVLNMVKEVERLETELELLKHDWNELVSRHEIQTYELNTLKQSIEEAETRVGYKMDDGSVKLISDLQKYPTKGMIHVALLELKDGE